MLEIQYVLIFIRILKIVHYFMSAEGKVYSRRDFLDSIISGLTFLILGLLVFLAGRFYKSFREKNEIIIIPQAILKTGLNTFDKIFIIRSGNNLEVLKRKCPHLGCTVEFNSQRNQILCPCHGSLFNEKGAYLRGPVKRDLDRLDYTITKNQEIRVIL